MNKPSKYVLGITLIEVMLTLSIAALVMVTSIRYYQTTQNANNANRLMAQLQQYIVAGNSIYLNTGSFPTKTAMEAVLPGGTNAWRLPWGGTGTYAPVTSGTSVGFTFEFGTRPGTALCQLIRAKLRSNPKLILAGDLSGSGVCDMVIYNGSN